MLLAYHWPLMALFVILGLVFGSFGTVLVTRLPADRSIFGRSHCPRCRHTLLWYDLIPVVSFLLLRGQCRYCRRPIAVRYVLMELSSAVLFAIALLVSSSLIPAVLLAFILWLLLLVSLTDAETRTIPDALSIPLIAVAAAYAIVQKNVDILGIFIPALFFLVQWAISRGRWVGSGDILLATASGFLVGGWKGSLLMLGLSYIIGAVVASFLLLRGRVTSKSTIAFGPYLVLGTLIVMFSGTAILAYLIGGH